MTNTESTTASLVGKHGYRAADTECGRFIVKRGIYKGQCSPCVTQRLIDNSGPNGYVEQLLWMQRDQAEAARASVNADDDAEMERFRAKMQRVWAS